VRAARSTLRHVLRTPSGLFAVVVLLVLLVVAVIAPGRWGVEAQQLNLNEAAQGASRAHWAGTDELGRDVFKRVLVATRLSLELAAAAALMGALLGIPIGALTGVLGPRLRRLTARAINLGLIFPAVLVALFLTTVIGPGPLGATVAIGVALAPGFARTAQTLASGIASTEYVAAARVVGVSRRRLLTRYVLPNISETLALQVAASVGIALIAVSALSFLGLGVQTPKYDWGSLLASGLKLIYVAPATALAPGAAIVIAGLAFNLLGESLAKAMNPVLRVRAGQEGVSAGEADAGGPVPLHERRASSAVRVPVAEPVLRVRNLSVRFRRARDTITAVDGVSFDIGRGEIVGIVGESGSGKTMLALALARLVPHPGRVDVDQLELGGRDLLGMPARARRAFLGTKLAVVFQDPSSSLNPVLRIGRQLGEAIRVHRGVSRGRATELGIARLTDVHIPGAARRIKQYPHEFSGGMRQRAMIAMGLMGEPEVIIADEPTTALDVTVQAQILDLLQELNRTQGTAVVFISHDLGVVSQLCDRIFVMYAGRIVEEGSVASLLDSPAHPYTRALLGVVPDLAIDREQPLATIPGSPPDPGAFPEGCRFAPRCPLAFERCSVQPDAFVVGPGRAAECWLAPELANEREARPA
jgi:peptide/nickel transport system permease protein